MTQVLSARRQAALATLLGAVLAALQPVQAAPVYGARGTCAGFPRVELTTPPGWCVALLADASSGLRFPRRILEVSPGRFWVIDMGSWEPGRGRLLEFVLAPGGAAAPLAFSVLAEKLDRPLGLALGPDGRVYVGEAGRIWRTEVGGIGAPIRAQTLIDGLPSGGAHPLKEIVFGSAGRLYVNIGSASDACRGDSPELPLPCPEVEGREPRAAVYEAVLGGADSTLQSFKPYASGLRNSVALAFVAGPNVLLQGENSIDYADPAAPPEELNVLRQGANYGWPYCVGARRPARGYERRFDCAKSVAPAMLWPAHAAPLHMVSVAATAGNAFAGQLVVAWHGYRAGGHRVVSFALDAKGRPAGAARPWIAGWSAAPGVRPLGAPTGLLVDSAGRLLVVEDRHRTLLMLVRERI